MKANDAAQVNFCLFGYRLFALLTPEPTMALKPKLRMKVDDLFMKFITDKAVQKSLNQCLQQIVKGDAVTYATPQVWVTSTLSYTCMLCSLCYH